LEAPVVPPSLGETVKADVATAEAESPLLSTAWDGNKMMGQGRINQVFSPQTLPPALEEAPPLTPQVITVNLPRNGKGRRSLFLRGAPERIKEIWERPQSVGPPPTTSSDKPTAQGPEKRRRRSKKEMETSRENEKKVLAKKKVLMAKWRENDGQRSGSKRGEVEAEAEAGAEEGGHSPPRGVSVGD
jgi:hypothetical protein